MASSMPDAKPASPALPLSAAPTLRVLDLPKLARVGLGAAVLAMVFALALADGGRHPLCLSVVEAAVFLLLALVLARGGFGAVRLPVPWWCMLGALGIASITSVRPDASVHELLLWITYGGLAVLTAYASRESREWLLDALVLPAGALCAIALFWFWGSRDLGNRWCSTFYWPNPFAAFLLLVLPLCVVRTLRAPSARAAMSHGAVSVLLATSLIFTYSRGAWLAGAVALAAGFLWLPRRTSTELIRGLAIAGAVATSVALLSLAAHTGQAGAVVARAASLTDGADASAQGHLLFWRNALKIFAAHPLTGTGPGTFGAVHAAYQTDLRYYARDAHSLYLQSAAETGLLGLAALLALLVGSALVWVRLLRRTAETEEYTPVLGVGLGLLAFLLHNAVDMDWSFPANPAMAWALAGVLAGAFLRRESGDVAPRTWKGLSAVLVIGLLLATVVVVRRGQANRCFVQGQRLAGTGEWEDAAAAFASAQAWNPLNARYLGAEAEARLRIVPPEWERAEVALRHAMRIDRANAWPRWQLAVMLTSVPGAGPPEFAEGERLLREALRLDPINRPKVYSALAQLYTRWDRAPEAGRVYDLAVERYLGAPPAAAHVPLPPEQIDLMAEAAEFRLGAGDLAGAGRISQALLGDGPRATSRASVAALTEHLRLRSAVPLPEDRTRR